ncbi:MAG: acyltransferase family protein, partial [Gammaproteobacteria bacterium]
MNKVNHSNLSYRPEIDGLRAIAVLSVIFYHAKIIISGRDWFEGGFIGVDIFFVISGYLITRIILSEIKTTGSFSFLNFYERRARRILPMLFVVIFASMPFAWQKLLPSDFVEYAESILASLFFGSNFFFYFRTTEYGADSSLLKPFLHTWSLGVEEQFYLFFPILAIIAYKYFYSNFLTILIGLSLLSLQFSELMVVKNSDLNFYLPFSRFWELAIGSILAYRELHYKYSNNGFASKSLPIFGLYLIVYSILFFDAKTPHPSFHTLIPIIGVALIIGFASKDELVGKLLASKPFVWVGLISYSAYLWHFPIFALSRQSSLSHTNYDKFEWIVVTLILSIASFVLVETPLRNVRKISGKLFLSIILSAFVVASVLGTLIIKGVIVNSEVGFVGELLDNGAFREEHKAFELNYDYSVLSNSKPNILIVGNSHAEDLLKALTFSDVANGYNINLTSPIKRVKDVNYQVRCLWDYLKNNDTTCTQGASQGAVEYGPNISKQYSSADIVMLASQWYTTDTETLSLSIPKMLDDGKKVIVVG